MILSISEHELILLVGESEYMKMCTRTAKENSQREEFKNGKYPIFVDTSIYELRTDLFLLIQSTIDRRSLPFIDFGIHAAYVSDSKEEIINKQLDIYNEMKGTGGADLKFITGK